MQLFPEVFIKKSNTLSIDVFREFDYYAVENYSLPIELMMENAGLHLAKIVSSFSPNKELPIVILVGPGNNGGGGCVAARRLAGWGYKVNIKLLKDQLQELPQKQFDRAIKFGAVNGFPEEKPQLIIDAILGFSQKLPLRENVIELLSYSKSLDCKKVSLDIPTGLFNKSSTNYFEPNVLLSLAAPKDIFFLDQLKYTNLYVCDLGIPKKVYNQFNSNSYLDYDKSSIYKVKIR